MIYSTGCKALDALFGGYYTRVIHLLVGPSKAGKTTLSSYVPIGKIFSIVKAATGTIPDKGRFFVIDGDGGFDFERAEQVWRAMGIEDPNEVFDRLSYWQPTEFDDQHKIITAELSKLIKEKEYLPLYIAADPLIALYRGIVLRTSHQFKMVTIGDYTGKLDLQFVNLRQLAVKYNVPVVISSWPGSPVGKAMGAAEGESPSIGGRAFGFIPKVTVELRIPKEGSLVREAYLYKHRSKPEGGSCYFKLTEFGIADVDEADVQSSELKA